MPFTDHEHVLPAANLSNFGLAAGVWTRDISHAHRIASELQTGTVWVNCYNVFDAALPFGGFKESGWGREMGRDVLDNYLETKSVCVKLKRTAVIPAAGPQRAPRWRKRQGLRSSGPRTKRATPTTSPCAAVDCHEGVVQFVVDVRQEGELSFAQVLDRC
jgi:hypothetical protein